LWYSTFLNYQPVSQVKIDVAPSSALRLH